MEEFKVETKFKLRYHGDELDKSIGNSTVRKHNELVEHLNKKINSLEIRIYSIESQIKAMKQVKTIADIENDPRIDRFIKNYDGFGVHMVECKDGYKFENERTIDIGSVKDICYCINNYLEKSF